MTTARLTEMFDGSKSKIPECDCGDGSDLVVPQHLAFSEPAEVITLLSACAEAPDDVMASYYRCTDADSAAPAISKIGMDRADAVLV